MKRNMWLAVLTALALTAGRMGTVWAEIIPPNGEGQIGFQAVVLCDTLTVRQERSSRSKAVKTLHYGDTFAVQDTWDGWASCFTSDDVDAGQTGWVNSDYIIINPAWYRTEETTPVYAWNDTKAPKVALLNKDITMPILKTEGQWLIVSLRGATGWIYSPNATTEAAVPADSTERIIKTGRPDGERFEAEIMLEGMTETVRYEHIRNDALGIEMDYDYEMLERHSEAGRELFTMRFDGMNRLEIVSYTEKPDTVCRSVSEALSKDYDIIMEQDMLDGAGNCTRIDASAAKDARRTPDLLQTVYIIPTAAGCLSATVHNTFESAEGFGARIRYIMDTLVVLNP